MSLSLKYPKAEDGREDSSLRPRDPVWLPRDSQGPAASALAWPPSRQHLLRAGGAEGSFLRPLLPKQMPQSPWEEKPHWFYGKAGPQCSEGKEEDAHKTEWRGMGGIALKGKATGLGKRWSYGKQELW